MNRGCIDTRYADHLIYFVWANSPDADCVLALIAQLFLVKSKTHSFLGNQNNLVIAASQVGVDQAIAFFNLDGDDPAFANVPIIGKVRFLDDTRLCRENDVKIFVPGLIDRIRANARFLRLDSNRGGDFFFRSQLKNVGNRSAFSRASHLRNLVNFFDVGASRFREKHQIVVRRGGEKMLDEIAFLFLGRTFARGHPDHALAAAALRAKGAHSCALDETAVGDADDAAFVGDEILHVDLTFIDRELRQARRTMLVAKFPQLLFDDSENALLLGENVAQILNCLDQFLIFFVDLVPFETGQLIQTKIENLIGLVFAEGVAAFRQARGIADENADLLDLLFGKLEREELDSGLIAIGRSANDADEFVEVGERDEITFEGFGAFFGFAQFEAGPSQYHFAAMLDVSAVGFLERKQFRPAVIDRQHDDRERAFHRGVLVEIVDNDLGIGVALELDYQPCVFVRFVADRGDLVQNFFVHQIGDALDQRRAIDVERDFGDDDLLLAAFDLLDAGFAAHFHAAAAGLEVLANTSSS